MEYVKWFGYPLSAIGLVLSFPPLVQRLTSTLGEAGRLGGTVIFAIGWALLLAYLVFRLGMETGKNRVD